MTAASSRAVSSLNNPAVKAARALRLRKARGETGLFLAEGLKVVAEAVALGHRPRLLLFGKEARDHPLLAAAAAVAGESLEVTEAILAKVSRRDNPQMVLGVFDQSHCELESLDPAGAACWVALEAIRDPGNLGTILRTVDAAGCGGTILIGDCCDPYSVEAVRASMGSIFATPIFAATTRAFLTWRVRWPGTVIGTLLSAERDFRAGGGRPPFLVVMGPEQAGLSADLASACDATVKIPMGGRADSLNLAVATGVMVYALAPPPIGDS